MYIRLNKFLSHAGVSSRRKAEEYITSGRVRVNGEIVKILGTIIQTTDEVFVDNEKIKISQHLYYIALYKPVGYVVSRRSFPGQRSVYELLPDNIRTVVWSIGRLDKDSEGLIFFTNDGGLTQIISHPKFGHEKTYVVNTGHELSEATLNRLRKGIVLEDGKTISTRIDRMDYGQYTIVLREGKNRQIRRMIRAVGAHVVGLKRVQINNFSLGAMKSGQWKFITKKDILGS